MEASKSSPTDQTLHNVINGGRGGFGQKQISARLEGGDQQARFVSGGQKENHKQKQRFLFIGVLRKRWHRRAE
uniref:Uncharacterized protein n=1 Tax=Anguilla anguilla TaxID=7936 RepID=A0A0E9U581_ANGAN